MSRLGSEFHECNSIGYGRRRPAVTPCRDGPPRREQVAVGGNEARMSSTSSHRSKRSTACPAAAVRTCAIEPGSVRSESVGGLSCLHCHPVDKPDWSDVMEDRSGGGAVGWRCSVARMCSCWTLVWVGVSLLRIWRTVRCRRAGGPVLSRARRSRGCSRPRWAPCFVY